MSRSSSSVTSSRCRFGIAAHQADGEIGRQRQEPHDRPGDLVEERQRAGHHHAPALGLLHGDALRGEFAEHQGDVRQEQRDDDDRHRAGGTAEEAQRLLERLGERHGRRSRREEAGEGDADLDRGEESVRFAGEPGEHGTRRGPGLESLQLTFTQRHERQLGTGERGVDDDQHEHQADLGQVLRHRSVRGGWADCKRRSGCESVWNGLFESWSNFRVRKSGGCTGTVHGTGDARRRASGRRGVAGLRRDPSSVYSRRTVGPREAGGSGLNCTGGSQRAIRRSRSSLVNQPPITRNRRRTSANRRDPVSIEAAATGMSSAATGNPDPPGPPVRRSPFPNWPTPTRG